MAGVLLHEDVAAAAGAPRLDVDVVLDYDVAVTAATAPHLMKPLQPSLLLTYETWMSDTTRNRMVWVWSVR